MSISQQSRTTGMRHKGIRSHKASPMTTKNDENNSAYEYGISGIRKEVSNNEQKIKKA